MIVHHAPLTLASGSSIRQAMLRAAGLNFSVVPSGVDEEAITRAVGQGDLPALAQALARAKASAVSARQPDTLVIGADQLCVCDGQILSKPGSYERAEAQLAQLSGREHRQISGVALMRGGEALWTHVAEARLTMRALAPAEIARYVAADAPLASCGSYKFEALGRHLFAAVEGDHDVIAGLPLVPLLAQLHQLRLIEIG